MKEKETMPTEKSPPVDPVPRSAPSTPSTAETLAPALEEPAAGGNYVRDPVTGALSPNPDHIPPTSSPE